LTEIHKKRIRIWPNRNFINVL